MVSQQDPRRNIPGTDRLLEFVAQQQVDHEISDAALKRMIQQLQAKARSGDIAPDQVKDQLLAELAASRASSLTPVLNATGVIIHTNLGRSALSQSARDAVHDATGYVDVEMDLGTGKRSRRGAGTRHALLEAVPEAEDVLVVNNAAAALALATAATTHGAGKKAAVISRGELVEIGAGFRLPDLIASTGVELTEVGTTNRTTVEDYAQAITADTGCLLKIHPSNFWVGGFTSTPSVAELRTLATEHDVPLIVDQGSGLLRPDPVLKYEPTVVEALNHGADAVLCSGDKLLGGPQAGIIFGTTELIHKISRHPLARAFRADKLALAALEATVRSGTTPTIEALHYDAEQLFHRTHDMAQQLGVEVIEHDGRVGGGGGAGVRLPGWALSLNKELAYPLRTGNPAILTRVHQDCAILDLRCIPAEHDTAIVETLRALIGQKHNSGTVE